MKTFIRKLLLSENDWDLAINMADMWHLGLGKKVCLYDVTDIFVQKFLHWDMITLILRMRMGERIKHNFKVCEVGLEYGVWNSIYSV